MNCFYHPQTVAVAICKNCSRGLCQACAAEVENGIACKGRCETEVISVNQLIQRGKRSGAAYPMLAVFFAALGVLMAGGGLLSSEKKDAVGAIGLGVLLIIFGLGYAWMGRRINKRTDSK